jgi:membrane-associated protease RseP (regulator of RpoE activity)
MRRAILIAATLLIGATGSASADVSIFSASSHKGQLGLVVIGLTDELKQYFGSGKDGVLVGRVAPDSPAARAGIQVGDVLAKVDGKPVQAAEDVWPLLAGKKQGDVVALEIRRMKQPMVLPAKLAADAPAASAIRPPFLPPIAAPFGLGGDDALQQLQDRLDRLEQRMHKLDGT